MLASGPNPDTRVRLPAAFRERFGVEIEYLGGRTSELQTRLASAAPPVLLEALPEKYFRHSHLPSARNLPHDQVDALAAQIVPDKAAEIVVYCASATCQNSTIAAERLVALGYTNVREYHEGKQDWIDAGLPVEGEVTRRAAAA